MRGSTKSLAAAAAIDWLLLLRDLAANFVNWRGNGDGRSLGPSSMQPAGRKPLLGDHKLRESAVQANLNVGLRGHRWMAHRTGSVAIEPDFGRDRGQGPGLAFGTNHRTPQKFVDLWKNPM